MLYIPNDCQSPLKKKKTKKITWTKNIKQIIFRSSIKYFKFYMKITFKFMQSTGPNRIV